MGEQDLRNALLELYPEDLVDEFLDRVTAANQSAMTRIARAKTVVSTEETPVEEVVERTVEDVVEDVVEVEEVQEVEAVVVEETEQEVEAEEPVEEQDTVIELDETFVADLVGSPEFEAALRTAIQPIIDEFKQELIGRMTVVEETVKEEREWVQDKPARTKRAVVSYRAQNAPDVVVEAPVTRTYKDIAAENVNKIFGEV